MNKNINEKLENMPNLAKIDAKFKLEI